MYGVIGRNCRLVNRCKLDQKWEAYRRFIAKARPEGDFKYRSKPRALSRSVKAMAVLFSRVCILLYMDFYFSCEILDGHLIPLKNQCKNDSDLSKIV